MKKTAILSVLLIVASLSILSCTPTASQEEYQRLDRELSEAQSELASLQSQLAEAENLQSEYDALDGNYEALNDEMETLQDSYDELNAEYEELSDKYDKLNEQYEMIAGEETITEEAVEQALFEAINEERRQNGLNELEWNHTLDLWATAHSEDMAEDRELEYSVKYDVWQDVWRTAGHRTVDGLVSSTMTIWKDSLRFKRHFLNSGATVGAVAVHKSGDVYYITYFAHII
jgi:hypothetical protein